MSEENSNTVEAGPVSFVLKMIGMTIQWYLPESQKDRFIEIGKGYSKLDSHQWEKGFHMAKVKLNRELEIMRSWQNRSETDELIGSWDDEVLFFYVLHFQFLQVRLFTMDPEQMIPAGWDDFWNWGMIVGKETPWIFYTFPTVSQFMKLELKPIIWRFVAPSDVKLPSDHEVYG